MDVSVLARSCYALMMQVAILSDIHGNYEAFSSVLEDMDTYFPDVADIISLGDIVGYGPNPEECVRLLRKRGICSVAGNHELGVGRTKYRACFNAQSLEVVRLTHDLLSQGSVEFLRTLPLVLSRHGSLFVHGLPPRSAFQYLWELDDEKIIQKFTRFLEQIAFVGHTHNLGVVKYADGVVSRQKLPEGFHRLDTTSRYMVNVGAVGQPRDGDPRAKYLVWETRTHELVVRYVPYDIAETVRKMLELGIPQRYADRLLP
ncbi:MAG: metallophosphatase family protein [Desulfovibrionales bacterium]|nr:metallophosphatase family protein [Desulfovibrionales bacterium]